MARKKQARPKRGGVDDDDDDDVATIVTDTTSDLDSQQEDGNKDGHPRQKSAQQSSALEFLPVVVNDEEGVEIAEISLMNVVPSVGFKGIMVENNVIAESHIEASALKVRLQISNQGKFRIGGWQELSSLDVVVELVAGDSMEVLMSGLLDGPDDAISGLVYLIRHSFFTLKARQPLSGGCLPGQLCVLVTERSFGSFETLIANNSRSVFSKSTQHVIAWLRPELSAESINREGRKSLNQKPKNVQACGGPEENGIVHTTPQKQQGEFDPTALYDAVRPSKDEPCTDMAFTELLPELRPYQRRAIYWMIGREQGTTRTSYQSPITDPDAALKSENHSSNAVWSEHPLWVPVASLDGMSRFFYNPYSGYLSKKPHNFLSYVHGGILADEMGLGKTVELLGCILANPNKKALKLDSVKAAKMVQAKLDSRKRDRVDCTCGATREDPSYDGSWIQCDICDAWQHALCVGYIAPPDVEANLQRIAAQGLQPNKRSDNKMQLGKRARESETFMETTPSKRVKKQGKEVSSSARGRASTKESWVVEDDKEAFVCGKCAEIIGSVEVEGECGATLVVCPTPILRQWQDEISRHVRAGALRVMVYEGVQKGARIVADFEHANGISEAWTKKVVGAHDLATADLVLTTYDTLRGDLFHIPSDAHANERFAFRKPKRYRVIPTPLTRLKWWRVCLDEAQMVESVTARATEMALSLRAFHRWCVSGTPIQRGLDDLFGLLRFLGAEPFDDYRWWSLALKQPYEEGKHGAIDAMHDFFQGLMWRSTKLQVMDELALPPQEERLVWLRFSPIEAHFYRQQHERCAVKAREIIAEYRKNTGRISSEEALSHVSGLRNKSSEKPSVQNELYIDFEDRPLTHKEAAKLLNHLLRLRQACCHPQVGSAGIRSLQRSPMTMDEILEVLADKARLEAEEAQRSLIGALNGLAALALIENNIGLAVSIYREALASSEENSDDIRVDPLQKLHTLHNLAEILGSKSQLEGANEGAESEEASQEQLPGRPEAQDNLSQNAASILNPTPSAVQLPGIPKTLRDHLLVKQCQEIKARYMATFHAKLASVREDFQITHKQVEEGGGGAAGQNTWWLDILMSVQKQPDHGKELVKKIRDQLLESDHLGESGNMGRVKHRNTSSLALRFRDISGLEMVLLRELDAIEAGRRELLQRLMLLDARMDNPDPLDVERAGLCSRCQPTMDGPLCAHCEAEEFFQAYENRLFLLKVTAAGDELVSAEEALIAQHSSLALKRIGTNTSGLRGNQMTAIEDLERGTRYKGPGSALVTRAPSETERILTIMRGHVKLVTGRDGLAAAKQHLLNLEAMRKEYAQARVLALAQRGVLYALDEINMATTRLQLWYPGEDSHGELEKLFKLHPEEVPQRNVQLTGEKFMALDDFMRAKGQLRYLKGLKYARRKAMMMDAKASGKLSTGSQNYSSHENGASETTEGWEKAEEESCPVCHEKLGSQFMVLPCGHLLCFKCFMVLVQRSTLPHGSGSQKRINCPSCRRRANVGDVAYVDNVSERLAPDPSVSQFHGGEDRDEELTLSVKGSYGTKLEAVVRRILWVKAKDPNAKVLLFSEWQDVLDVVEHALTANHITFARIKERGKLNAALDRFRGTSMQIVPGPGKAGRQKEKREQKKEQVQVQVLLLPIRHGANGLNLVEAQHVILMEPLLNPGAEAQAINRVHRIGQQHVTYVHRFIVSDTVEESIYRLRQKNHNMNMATTSMRRTTNSVDGYVLTLSDVNVLFTPDAEESNAAVQEQLGSVLRSLPPGVAAAAAAEARRISGANL